MSTCRLLPCCCGSLQHSLRFLVLICSLIAFTLLYANNISFNFSVICIVRPEPGHGTASSSSHNNNDSQQIDPKEPFYHDFSAQQRNWLFSASAIGAIFSCLIITQLIDAIGMRHTFTLYGLLSAVSCMLMPAAVQLGFAPVFLLRLLQGSPHPVQYIMINQLSRHWAPLKRTSTYLLLLSTQFQLGPMLTMPMSGLLCESSLGWPFIYYIQGLLTVLIFIAFFAVFEDTPKKHPCISERELEQLQRDKLQLRTAADESDDRNSNSSSSSSFRLAVPYRQMLKDPVLWIVMATYGSDELGFLIFTQYGPIYLNKVLGKDIRHTGFLAALPFLLSMLSKFVAGPINDRLPWKSERIRVNIFTAISQIGAILAFVALSFLPMASGVSAWLVQAAYTAVTVFCGLDFLGVIRCSHLISQHFASTVMACESMISNLTVLLLPLIVGLVAPNNTVEEWSHILLGIALFEALTIVVFFAFCDSKPRPWTKVRYRQQQRRHNEKKRSNSSIYAIATIDEQWAAGDKGEKQHVIKL